MSKILTRIKLLYAKVKNLLWLTKYLRFIVVSNRQFFNIFTHLTKIERLLLYKLSLSLPHQSTVVEIGSYLGASALFFASGIKERGGKLYCIDTWYNEGMAEGQRDTFEEFLKNIEPMRHFIIPLRGQSVDIAKTFNERIDLLFIDGDHSYEGIKGDVESWLPKIKDDGIIIFHDYGWAEGVKRVVKEYIKPIQVDGHFIQNTYWAKIKKNE